jgi:proliferating cell nuclear antigen PCNA
MSKTIFEAKTREGHAIKVLIEVLQNCIRDGGFIFSKEGMELLATDSNRRLLVFLKMDRRTFDYYKCTKEKILVGLKMSNFHKKLKGVQRKDSLVFDIYEEEPNFLCFASIAKEKTRQGDKNIVFEPFQVLDIEMPDEYDKTVNIPSSDYQKMCKHISGTMKQTEVFIKHNQIGFYEVMKSKTVKREGMMLGEYQEDIQNVSYYKQTFETDQITRLIKIAGMSMVMNISLDPNKPMKIEAKIGNLGYLEIYIKSQEQIELEKKMEEEDEEEIILLEE